MPLQPTAGVVEGAIWTVLAVTIYAHVSGQTAPPAWLLAGLGLYWLMCVLTLAASWSLRLAPSVEDSWAVRVLRVGWVLLSVRLITVTLSLATVVFWAVLFVVLVRR